MTAEVFQQYGPDAVADWAAHFEAVLDRVRAAGGRVALDPIPISASGIYARFFDPDGNSFGLWQAAGKVVGGGT